MVGSNIQLFALGPQDFHLTGNPQITHFKSVFRRHTNFTKDLRKINYSGTSPTFGSDGNIGKITKDGDLLSNVYFEVTVEGTSENAVSYTVNHFGNSLFKKVEFEIGGYIVDTHHSQWLQIYDELTDSEKSGEQAFSSGKGGLLASNIRTNTHPTSDSRDLIVNSNDRVSANCPLAFGRDTLGTYTKRFIVPLKFWFTKSPSMYLPICALYNHEVKIKFDVEEKHKLIGDSTNITNLTLKQINLYGEYIHLDETEKRRFSQSNHEYIIEQVQLNNNGPYITSSSDGDTPNQIAKVDYELNFSHPVKYITWVVVNEGTAELDGSSNKGQGPCYFVSLCSSSLYENDGNDGRVEILFDGIEREVELPMMYYTRLYPKKYCKNTPQLDRIGLYSFALNPFDVEPSGTCNFSKINSRNIKIAFANLDKNQIKSKSLYFFAVNYNVLVITDGMAMVRYT